MEGETLALGSAGGGIDRLRGLQDVDFRNLPVDNDMVLFDQDLGKWTNQAISDAIIHALTGPVHTHSGGIAGRFLRETAATTFDFQAPPISRGGTVLSPVAQNINVWEARDSFTVTNVRARRTGGTGATVNARKNGSLNHLSSNLSLTTTNYTDGGAVQNTAYVAGDNLQIMIVSVTGAPTEIIIQVDFTRP